MIDRRSAEDWKQWHSLYDESQPLKERLLAVRQHIAASIAGHSVDPVRILSACAGDGRDLIGALGATHERKRVCAHLIESDAELVARGEAAARQFRLEDEITFHCADATRSNTYRGVSPAHVIVLAGVFGNLHDMDTKRLIASLRSLCYPGASVVWTRNLREFDDGERTTLIIKECFLASGFEEASFSRTPSGMFAVATHVFRGSPEPLPRDVQLFVFSGFCNVSRVTLGPHDA
jgi:hypothetical protein